MGARVTLVGPPPLIPRGIEAMGCEVSHDIDAIGAADVVYVLRMQQERMQEGANYVPSLREYTARWGVTPERLRPGQKVMHPGPMNRGVEIDPRVADAADALIETQVRAGLVVADGGALRPAHPRPRRRSSPRRARDGGGLMLHAQDRPQDDLVIRGARVLDPARASTRGLDVRIDGGVIAELGTALDANGHRVVEAAGCCSRPPSSTRTSTCARPAARTRRRSPRARRPPRRAATARSSRCRTPTRSSTRPRCSAR